MKIIKSPRQTPQIADHKELVLSGGISEIKVMSPYHDIHLMSDTGVVHDENYAHFSRVNFTQAHRITNIRLGHFEVNSMLVHIISLNKIFQRVICLALPPSPKSVTTRGISTHVLQYLCNWRNCITT